MRFIHLYLIAYFALLFGAGLTLWQAGAFSHVPPMWMAIAGIIAIGLGIILAVTSAKPTTITHD